MLEFRAEFLFRLHQRFCRQGLTGPVLRERDLDRHAQVSGLEGLHNIAQRMGGLGMRQSLLVVGSGQEYYRNIMVIIKPAGGFDPIHGALQPYVHQYQGRPVILDGAHGLRRRPCRTGTIIAQAAERSCGDFSNLRVVLNQQDFVHRGDTSLCRRRAILTTSMARNSTIGRAKQIL